MPVLNLNMLCCCTSRRSSPIQKTSRRLPGVPRRHSRTQRRAVGSTGRKPARKFAPIWPTNPSHRTGPSRVTIPARSFCAQRRLNRVLIPCRRGRTLWPSSTVILDHAFDEALLAWKKQQRLAAARSWWRSTGTIVFSDAAHRAPRRQEPREFPLPSPTAARSPP